MAHHDTSCDCDVNKLCALSCCPCMLDVKKIATLANKPKFICECCGRVANDAENLCKPQKM